MNGTGAPVGAVAVRETSALARLRARLACRRCALGWAAWLALAATIVALFGSL